MIDRNFNDCFYLNLSSRRYLCSHYYFFIFMNKTKSFKYYFINRLGSIISFNFNLSLSGWLGLRA